MYGVQITCYLIIISVYSRTHSSVERAIEASELNLELYQDSRCQAPSRRRQKCTWWSTSGHKHKDASLVHPPPTVALWKSMY